MTIGNEQNSGQSERSEAEQQQPVVMAEFVNGMTVRQLKEVVKNWPEINEYTGDECEVWIGTGGTSNPARYLFPLNRREDDGKVSADILLET